MEKELSFSRPESWLRISVSLAELRILKNQAARSCFPYVWTVDANATDGYRRPPSLRFSHMSPIGNNCAKCPCATFSILQYPTNLTKKLYFCLKKSILTLSGHFINAQYPRPTCLHGRSNVTSSHQGIGLNLSLSSVRRPVAQYPCPPSLTCSFTELAIFGIILATIAIRSPTTRPHRFRTAPIDDE